MTSEQSSKPPIAEHERRLVAPPGELLDDRREQLRTELKTTAQELTRWRIEVARLEERDRLLRAALADLDAAIERLHLKPVRNRGQEVA